MDTTTMPHDRNDDSTYVFTSDDKNAASIALEGHGFADPELAKSNPTAPFVGDLYLVTATAVRVDNQKATTL